MSLIVLKIGRFLLFLTCFYAFSLRASHIAGGEISYKFISQTGNVAIYEFTVKSYNYEFVGTTIVPGPILSSLSYYVTTCPNGVCDNFFQVTTRATTTARYVNPPNLPPCVKSPSSRRLIENVQTWRASVQESGSSYILKTENCCRNSTITNISSPDRTSAIYSIEITAESQRLNNSSPVFKSFPPSYFCGGYPIEYDNSATDAENDQIVYSFCAASGSNLSVQRPFSPPPYISVIYRLPNFSANAPMAGNPVVSINSTTGAITGTPTLLGEYVVSVCAEEYRNGVLLSRMSRDFQFNIVSCERFVTASLKADTVNVKTFSVLSRCDTTTITFKNTSVDSSKIVGYFWTFNIRDSIYTFPNWSPTITFPSAGRYKGKLVVSPNSFCQDSAFVEVNITAKLKPDFTFKYDTCSATPIEFTNTTPQVPSVNFWQWIYGDGTLENNRKNVSHTYNTAGTKTVLLNVTSDEGCKSTVSKSFDWRPAPAILIVEPDAFNGCVPAKVAFRNRTIPFDSTYKIVWNFGDGTTSNAFNPIHTYLKSDTFSVKIQVTSPIGCYKEDNFSNWIKVKPSPKADFDWSPKDVSNLKPTANFVDKSTTGIVNWRWFLSNKGYDSRQNPSFTYRDTGFQQVTLFAINQFGCKDSVSKTLYVSPDVTFYLPNAFTPNNDSNNDEFKGTGFIFGLKKFRLIVWNRWGEKVFETTDASEGWNGTKNNAGAPMPEGVYVYEVSFTTPRNQVVSKRDMVTLFR